MREKLSTSTSHGWWNALDPRMPQSCSIDTLESQVQSSFIRWLKTNFGDEIMIYNTPAKKWVAGIPDLICCCAGRSIWIEIKRWGQKPRPSQLSWLRLHARHGGVSFWGTDLMTLADLFLDAFEAGMLATTTRIRKTHSIVIPGRKPIVTGEIWRTKAWQ